MKEPVEGALAHLGVTDHVIKFRIIETVTGKEKAGRFDDIFSPGVFGLVFFHVFILYFKDRIGKAFLNKKISEKKFIPVFIIVDTEYINNETIFMSQNYFGDFLVMKNYYLTLGIDKNASHDDIKKAYRRKAKKSHPDVSHSKDSISDFSEIQEAYDILGNENSRIEYDSKSSKKNQTIKSDFNESTYKIFDSRKNHKMHNEGWGIFDTFSTLYNRRENEKYNLDITLTHAEAAKGGVFTIPVSIAVPCPHCTNRFFFNNVYCPECRDFGFFEVDEILKIKIPAGIRNDINKTYFLNSPWGGKIVFYIHIFIEQGFS